VLDFIEVRKWLQKGSFVQQVSNLCHDPLIPHQSTWARETLVFQVLRKMARKKNCFEICLREPELESDEGRMSCLTIYHIDAAETVLSKDIEIF